MSEPRGQFEGFYVPHSTQVPDTLFDELMAELSGAELKVVLYIIRRTFGFKKAQDHISLRQMVEGITTKDGKVLDRGTGLGKASVARAVSSLEARGVIVRNKRKSADRGDEATTYALKLRGAGMGVSQNETPAPQAKVEGPVSQNGTPPGLIVGHPRVSKRDPQGTELHGTENTVTVNGGISAQGTRDADRTDLRRLPDLGEDRDAIKALADVILEALGDAHSQAFYYLVAAKVPEAVVRRTLSEIRHDGAREPARVFAHRMKAYAAEALQKARSAEVRAAVAELGRKKASLPGTLGRAGE
jgi:predicted transcriptional regulator